VRALTIHRWLRTGVGVALLALIGADAFAQSIGYSYDVLNRLTQVVYADGTAVTYTYDPAGNRLTKTVTEPCVFSLNPTSANAASVAGSATVGVTAASHCGWTGTSNNAFLTVTAGASGTGNGTVAYAFAANTTGVARVGTLTIAGQTFTLTQSGDVAPVITTHPSNVTATSGTNATFTVAASGSPAPTYQWQVSANSGSTWTNLPDTAPYSGSATSNLTVTSVTTSLSGSHYRAVATNSVGSATSNPATLTVLTRVISLSGNLAFGNVAVNTTATATLTVANTGNSALTVTAITYPAGFSGDWAGGTIAADGTHVVTVTFAPTAAISYAGTVTVAANQTGGSPTIAASGAGASLAQMTTPAPGSTLIASNVQFQWTGGIGVSQYRLDAGTTPGGTDLFTQDTGTTLTATVIGLPFDGSPIYVRLGSLVGSTWRFNSYTYTASTTYLPWLGLGSGGPAPRDGATPPVRSVNERAAGSPGEMISPAPTSTLTASTVAFQWTGGLGVRQYWLAIGTTPDGTDLFNDDAGTQLSATVAGLPTDGQPIYVHLGSLIGSEWHFTSYAYTTTPIASAPAYMTVPAPGSTLTASTVQFQWTGGAHVRQYRLTIGTTPDGDNLFNQDQAKGLTAVVADLPTDGSRIYVGLWSLVDGIWQVNRYTYRVGTPALAQLTTPAPSSRLTASTVAFQWTGGMSVTRYRLQIGTAPGGTELFVGDEGTSLTATVTRLPTRGERVYVRLGSLVDATWHFLDYEYTAPATANVAAELIAPAPGSTLTASTVAFQWTGGTGVSRYRLEVGTTLGGAPLFTQDEHTSLAAIVSNLPTDGGPIYVRLWSLVDTTWHSNDYGYTAPTIAGVRAEMITPAPGSTLTASTVQFAWSGGSGVVRYRLDVGTAPGGTDLFQQDAHPHLTSTVAALPSDGRTIYVRLWSLISGRWGFADYTYSTPSASLGAPPVWPRENRGAAAMRAVVVAIGSGAARR